MYESKFVKFLGWCDTLSIRDDNVFAFVMECYNYNLEEYVEGNEVSSSEANPILLSIAEG